MLQGRRFVITGVNHLVVRVARALDAQRAQVTVLRRAGEDAGPLRLLPDSCRVLDSSEQEDIPALLAADLASAACLLPLAEDDLDNLRIAVAASQAAPDVPVVLRAFDPALADELEQGLNIRRAYSVSALAAPAFLAAACGDTVVETLRLGDGEVPLCRLVVDPGSPLIGRTTAAMKQRFGCAVIARSVNADDWQPVRGDGADAEIALGDHLLIGGPLLLLLRAIFLNAGHIREGRRQPRVARRARRGPSRRGVRHATLVPYIAAPLGVVLLLAVWVFGRALHLRLVDAIYFVVTTATTTGYGDISLKDSPDWIKLFGCLVMVSGGALAAILFSYFAAVATAERLDILMGRRASRLSGHVIVVGLGNLGYRVTRLLTDSGIGVAVLEIDPDARYGEALRPAVPVLTGDARLPENLDRASVGQASAFIACTNDDLANIQSCLHARRLNPIIKTVARVFDEALSEKLTAAFTIDTALSASQCAVSAFVGAASDERALRPLTVGGLRLIACRRVVGPAVTAETLAEWRAAGIRVLAFAGTDDILRPARDIGPAAFADGDEVILCGPADAVQAVMEDT